MRAHAAPAASFPLPHVFATLVHDSATADAAAAYEQLLSLAVLQAVESEFSSHVTLPVQEEVMVASYARQAHAYAFDNGVLHALL